MKFKISMQRLNGKLCRTLIPLDSHSEKFLMDNYKEDVKIMLPNVKIQEMISMFEDRRDTIVLDEEGDNYFDFKKQCWRYFRD